MLMRNNRGNYGPTPLQELLLKAALLPAKEAIPAWEGWKASADIDKLDAGSYRLLPLLYRNLHGLGVHDPVLLKFKGVYRHTWSKNHFLSQRMVPLLKAFHLASIETLILKGAALILLYYSDYGLRPMSDFDVLVRREDLRTAIAVLDRLDWTPESEWPKEHIPFKKVLDRFSGRPAFELSEVLLPFHHAIGFENTDGGYIDLHWHISHECLTPHSTDDFWKRAMPTQMNRIPVQVLNPTDQLLHICLHGSRWNHLPPVHWVADAMTILNTKELEIDWNHLSAQVEKHRLILPLADALFYLRETFDAPIPSATLRYLEKLPTSKREQVKYQVTSQPLTLLNFLKKHRCHYSQVKDTSYPPVTFFLKYLWLHLQYLWGLKHPWQVPICAVLVTIREILIRSENQLKRLGCKFSTFRLR